jgi:hypothetical protein
VPVRPLAIICNFAAFLAGLVLAAGALSKTVPFPKVGALWRKYQHYQEQGKDYSLLYLGSSRVYHEFVPEQFDAALAARGHKIKSLNFGQDGMWPPESLYMMRLLLKEQQPNLRWVFFELMNFRPLLEGNEASMRSVYWHDWRHTSLAMRHILTVPMDGQRTWAEKAGLLWQHFGMWLQQATHAGTGSQYLRFALKLERAKRTEPLKHAGWEAGFNGPLRGEHLTLFEREMARLRAGVAPRPIPPLLRDALDDIAAEIRAAGAEPIFVVTSTIHGAERFTDWPPPGQKVFAFDDPQKFPKLYDPARRYDPHHLDPIGAAEFTRLLAERFAQSLEEKK